MPARRAASVTARYMAPVSRKSKPRRRASARAALLLPAPAGPSTVMIMLTKPFSGGSQNRAVLRTAAKQGSTREHRNGQRLVRRQPYRLGRLNAEHLVGEVARRLLVEHVRLARGQLIRQAVDHDAHRRRVGVAQAEGA